MQGVVSVLLMVLIAVGGGVGIVYADEGLQGGIDTEQSGPPSSAGSSAFRIYSDEECVLLIDANGDLKTVGCAWMNGEKYSN